MSISGKKKVTIHKAKVISTFSEFKPKPWIIPFLKLCEENDGNFTSDLILDKFGLDKKVSYNIITRFTKSGFINSQGELLSEGKEILLSEKKLVPDAKTAPIEIEYTKDHLIKKIHPFFSLKEIEIKKENIYDWAKISQKSKIQNSGSNSQLNSEPNSKKKRNNENINTIHQLPDILLNSKFWNRSIDFYNKKKTKGKYRIEEIQSYGLKDSKITDCQVNFSLTERNKVIFEIIGDTFQTNKFEFDFAYKEMFDRIISWLKNKKNEIVDIFNNKISKDFPPTLLRVEFHTLSESNLKNFKKTFSITNFISEKLGVFDEIKLIDMPIMPATKKDAQLWSIYLLKDEINDHIFNQDYSKLKLRYEKLFGSFFGDIKLPEREVLAKEIYNSSGYCENFWFTTAIHDLFERSMI